MTRDPAQTYEPSSGLILKKSVALTQSATGGSYGVAATVSPDAPNGAMVPLYIALTVANHGTETPTLSVVANYSDGTSSAEVTKAGTASTNGSYALAAVDYFTLAKDGVYITSLTIKAKSSINSSTETLTCDILAVA